MKHPISATVGATIAVVLAASPFHAAVIVRESFSSGFSAGKIHDQKSTLTGTLLSSKWDASNSGVVLVLGNGLALPATWDVSSYPSGGLSVGYGECTSNATGANGKDTTNNTTGDSSLYRAAKTALSSAIPASGTLYFRALLMQESGAGAATTAAGNLRGIGFRTADYSSSYGKGEAYTLLDDGVWFAFRKTANGTGVDTSVELRVGGVAITLVDAADFSEDTTYLCVAKVDVDANGATFSGYAVPVESWASAAFSVESSAPGLTSAKSFTHLCFTGGYLTRGKSVAFDEFVVGETLSDVVMTASSADPVVTASSATGVSETGFTANGELTQVGASSAEIFFDISADNGETWAGTSKGVYAQTGAISHTATSLLSGATYLWRFRAVGAASTATSGVQTVTLAGAPVLGAPSATLVANAATLAVSLETPGLSGRDDTTVELWLAAGDGVLALQKTFFPVTVATNYDETVSNLAWGGSYRYAFKASVPYNGGSLVAWTPTNTFAVTGEIEWSAAAGTTDWHTAGNWDPAVVPESPLSANFHDVGGNVTASANATTEAISVNSTTPVLFNFAGHSLTGSTIRIGASAAHASATLASGDFSFTAEDAVRIGGATTGYANLDVGVDATLHAANINVGQNVDSGVAPSNTLVFATGSSTTVDGTLFLRRSHENRVEVHQGAALSANGIEIQDWGNALLVDGGTVNIANNVTQQTGSTGKTTGSTVEIRNGGTLAFGNNYYVNDTKTSAARLNVLDGGILRGHWLCIANDISSVDTMSSARVRVVVSNATVSVDSLSVCNADRHSGHGLVMYEDEGGETSVSTTGNLRISAADWKRSGSFNRNHFVRVNGGALSIAGNLIVGDGGKFYATHDGNHLAINRASARVSAGALDVLGASHVDFSIPSNGFSQVPLRVTNAAKFGTVPVDQGNNSTPLFTAAEWTPVNEVRVDALHFTGTQTLIEAGSLTGLSTEQVHVTAPNSMSVKVLIDGTSLTIRVSPSATKIFLR